MPFSVSIRIVADEDFALAGMVGGGDDTIALHALDQGRSFAVGAGPLVRDE